MKRYIHGSEDSLDLDVIYIFDDMPLFKECQNFCSDKIENRNIAIVKNGIIVDCYKGTIDELNNGLYYTYNLHEQDYDNPIEHLVERDVLIKVVRVLRCLLSHCSRTKYREEVKRTLKSSSWKERISLLNSIDFRSIDNYDKSTSKVDTYKIFAFQLGQLIGLTEDIELYTKSSISSQYKELEKYLYREKNSNIDDLINYIKKFIEIITSYDVIEENSIVYFKDFNKYIDLKNEKYI